MPAIYHVPDFSPHETAQLLDFVGAPVPANIPQQQICSEVFSAPPTPVEPAQTEPAIEPTRLNGAQKALLAHETPWLFGFCRQIMPTDRSEDAAQTAIEKFLQHGHEVDPQKIRSWLAQTVRHGLISSERRKKREEVEPKPHEELVELDSQRDTAADYTTERAEQIAASRQTLIDIMRDLNAAQKNLLIDYFVHGKSAGEIAAQEGISESAVLQRVARIRKAARETGLQAPNILE